jgi:hypothetical protein
MKVLALRAVAVLSLLAGNAVTAHHAPYGQFSIDDPVDFTGTVVGVDWLNPHAFVLVLTEVDGAEAVLRVELQGLRQLRNKGWTGDELKVGTAVRVVNAAREIDVASTLVCCARIYDLNGKEFYTDPRPGQGE